MNHKSNSHNWITKSTKDHGIFFGKTNHPKQKLPEIERMLSSANLENETHSESFSLRLSDSCIDETPDSLDLGLKSRQVNEIILISDSSSNESVPNNAFNHFKSNRLEHKDDEPLMNKSDDIESSLCESHKTPVQCIRKKKTDFTMQFSKNLQPERTVRKNMREIENSHTPHTHTEVATENVVLSDRKKKEILQWLSTNFNGSVRESSSTQDSIPNSRASNVSSGNSSLERLEQEFETPNNRAKFSKPKDEGNSTATNKRRVGQQSTLDQYFVKSKTNQPERIQINTPKSKTSGKSQVNSHKSVTEKEVIGSKSSRSTPKSSCRTPVHQKTLTPKRIIIPESESLESQTGESTPLISFQNNARRNILVSQSTESKSSHGKSSRTGCSSESWQQRIIIPESESFESNSNTLSEIMSNDNDLDGSLAKQSVNRPQIIPETSDESSDSISLLHESRKINERNQNNPVVSKYTDSVPRDCNTIDDCADILENLYGTDWRNKASTLICATEPKKQVTRKIVKEIQTERKEKNRKPEYPEKYFDGVTKRNQNTQIKPQTDFKKPMNRNLFEDSFINDDSTSDSSPNCSYYTALSNPTPSRNRLGPPATTVVKTRDKIHVKNVLAICDSDSDDENGIWKINDIEQRKLSFNTSTSSSTSEFDPEDIVPPKSVTKNLKVKKTTPIRTNLPPQPQRQITKKSFLASLSNEVPLQEADFKAMTYRVKYNSLKEDLCKFLYKLFNEKVFENQLPNDMSIEWSVRLRGTAGKCFNKQSIKTLGNTVRSSRIVLATKILDSPDRLRDTLIHEMCHAATWLINNVSDGHGSFWKAWASKARKVFPELPPISRCHNYEIQTKYTYKCTSCGYSIGRHSKSLDLSKKRCGYCHGKFELLINKVTKNGQVQKKSAAQAKQPSGFALYVKENYHLVKQKGLAVKHGEVMKVLGQQFSSIKLNAKPKEADKS